MLRPREGAWHRSSVIALEWRLLQRIARARGIHEAEDLLNSVRVAGKFFEIFRGVAC